jgi:hypothetical protein
MLLNDKSAVFALGLLGAIGYYGLKAMSRKTVVVVLPSSPPEEAGDYNTSRQFIAGLVQACKDSGCMLLYIYVPDLYHRYDALLSALSARHLQGSPVVCRVLDSRMLAALERSGSRFVAVLSPSWVSRSPVHIASIRPMPAAVVEAADDDAVVITTTDEWFPGAHRVTASDDVLAAAVSLRSGSNNSKHQQHMIITAAVARWLGKQLGMLTHMFKSVRILEGLSFSDGYEAIVRANNHV